MSLDVFGWLLSDQDAPPLNQDRLKALQARLSPDTLALARSGERTRAIYGVRKETGASLKEAMALVKSLEASHKGIGNTKA